MSEPGIVWAYATALVVAVWATVYFWLADQRETRRSLAVRGQLADIVVNGGFHPLRVELGDDRPIRLRFIRFADDESGWDDVEFPYSGVRRELPPTGGVVVDLGRLDPGEYAFFGAMGTMRGTLVVQGADGRHPGA